MGPAFSGRTGCADEDLTTSRSGVFLYQPGCNGSPLLRGHADGSGLSVIYTSDYLGKSPLHASNFVCSARDPAGGFYVMASGANGPGGLQLYHLAEDASGERGVDLVTTTPSFIEAERSQKEVFAFYFCSLAVGTSGTIFFQTMSQLWKIAP